MKAVSFVGSDGKGGTILPEQPRQLPTSSARDAAGQLYEYSVWQPNEAERAKLADGGMVKLIFYAEGSTNMRIVMEVVDDVEEYT